MSKKNIIGVFALVLCLALLAFAGCDKASAQAVPADSALRQAMRTAGIPMPNTPLAAPDFSLNLLNGGNRRLSSYRGQVVLLNFWATWCPPCVMEMPSMENLYQRFRNQGLEILAVNVGESTNTAKDFIDLHGFSYPIMMDTNQSVARQYGIQYFPTTFIVDRSGTVINMSIGFKQWDTPEMIAAFELLLRSNR